MYVLYNFIYIIKEKITTVKGCGRHRKNHEQKKGEAGSDVYIVHIWKSSKPFYIETKPGREAQRIFLQGSPL